MKTKKTIATIAVIFGIALAMYTACKDEPETEQPKAQSATITGLFDNNSSATVKGTFTDTEWEGVADKIKDALNFRFFDTTNETLKIMFQRVYAPEKDVVIIIEKTSEYPNYKTTGDKKTIYLNYNILGYEKALRAAVGFASGNLFTGKTDMAKATSNRRVPVTLL